MKMNAKKELFQIHRGALTFYLDILLMLGEKREKLFFKTLFYYRKWYFY